MYVHAYMALDLFQTSNMNPYHMNQEEDYHIQLSVPSPPPFLCLGSRSANSFGFLSLLLVISPHSKS